MLITKLVRLICISEKVREGCPGLFLLHKNGMRNFLLALLLFSAVGCTRSFEAHDNLSEEDYEKMLMNIAPYVLKKSDDFTFEERFLSIHKGYYRKAIEKTNAEIKYFTDIDTAFVFHFVYKDLSSLYEHYHATGGYFRTDENGDILFMNLLYYTPRLAKEELHERGEKLFKEMVTRGNVKAYIGNRQFIHTPNNDFYYNTRLKRWDYTPNSSWKFLQEALAEPSAK